MTFETWITFTLASAFVVLIPGPNIVLTVNYAISRGAWSGIATVPGVVAGAFVAMSVSLAGAGAVLMTSATLFSMLKLAGAAYLLWLAYQLWTAPAASVDDTESAQPQSLRRVFWQAFLVSALNPKGPIFYMAFVPQFVDPSGPVFVQFAILIATFLVVAALNSLIWLFGASGMRHQLRRPAAMRLVNRIGASCLFVAGFFAARASRVSG